MQRFRKVLVGIDLAVSDRLVGPSGHPTRDILALEKAAWLARQGGGALRLVAALPLDARAAALDRRSQRAGRRTLVASAERRLERLAERVGGDGLETSVRARIGAPAASLRKEAAWWNADLVVVGGGAESAPTSLGGVAAEVFRSVDVPVWVARRGVPVELRHVLAAVALDEHSHGVLRLAASFAQRTGAALSVLHVVERSDAVDRADVARHAVHAWVRAHAPNVKIGEVRVERGEASPHVVAAAERLPADVVMIGPSNRSPLMAFLGGRPSSRLFGALPCSLVCARRIPGLAGQEWGAAVSDERRAMPAT